MTDQTPEHPPAPPGDEPRAATAVQDAPEAPTDGDAGGPAAGEATGRAGGHRLSVPLVPVLAVLLVLLLAGVGWLWTTRPGSSAVASDDYVGALQAARSAIVDVASFDYVTLDDDITQIKRVTTGDLRTESVQQLDQQRQQLTDAQAVVDTEVVGAAVGSADDRRARVFAVIQSTQKTKDAQQGQVQRYRVQLDLTKVGDRWLLSGITGR